MPRERAPVSTNLRSKHFVAIAERMENRFFSEWAWGGINKTRFISIWREGFAR